MSLLLSLLLLDLNFLAAGAVAAADGPFLLEDILLLRVMVTLLLLLLLQVLPRGA